MGRRAARRREKQQQIQHRPLWLERCRCRACGGERTWPGYYVGSIGLAYDCYLEASYGFEPRQRNTLGAEEDGATRVVRMAECLECGGPCPSDEDLCQACREPAADPEERYIPGTEAEAIAEGLSIVRR